MEQAVSLHHQLTSSAEEQRTRAWLLDFGQDCQAVIALHEMSQVQLSIQLFEIPKTPPYCRQTLIFENSLLPVIDMGLLLNGISTELDSEIVGICVYQEKPRQALKYAGIHLKETPVVITVSDQQTCSLPETQPIWQFFAPSCILHEERKIPIIDPAALFSAETREQIQALNAT
ncbi:chemotaxis protein CheW [Candidatus Venteria ishoeyi]|uniref:CheW-like domain protein n=1 Tax=Candidatus Venteria ishoeyi TaxID=1899563 RepID=A0A1H6FBN1_9GAMM|nr:chemotaxis protein CheW [Candidatus Venteria ishoeyi]MDM8547187.1 chemotaxis protein CheW [Candidatus Venteria ishoeyi]SEH06546.1 CheW-like domain protein [Candidatus Venteria ishoeyi]